MKRPRPLDPVRSLKAKWSVVILASVAVTAGTSQLGLYLGWPVWVRPVVAAVLALGAVQVLSHGMILPLREMAAGAAEMRRGEYHRRVKVTAKDEIGQLADAFNQMSTDLAEVDRLQKEFVANASHELRTPVAALRVQIENLADGVTESDGDTFRVMQAQAEHLSKLVAQLLDLSRLEASAGPGALEPCDVELLLNEIIEECQLIDADAAVELSTDGAMTIWADEVRLHQLFTNLIGNALRFTPEGDRVLVSAVGGGVDLTVEIRDRGPGIPNDQRTKVFERFWQSDGTTPTGAGGAGLGLAICKRIVDRHHGTIELGENEPKGTRVSVVLPIRDLSDLGDLGDLGREHAIVVDQSEVPSVTETEDNPSPPATPPAPGPTDRSAVLPPQPPWVPPVSGREPAPLPDLPPRLAAAIAFTATAAGYAIQQPIVSTVTLSVAAVGAAAIVAAAGTVTSRLQQVALALLAATGALLSVRMSPWVAAVEVLAVGGLAWLLAIDGLAPERPRSWLLATGESLVNLFDWVPWLGHSFATAARSRAPERDIAALARAVAVAGAVVVILGALLASGDAVFGWAVGNLFGGSWFVDLVLVAIMVVPASILALTAQRRNEVPVPSARAFRTEMLAALWATTAMLAIWCVIQVVVALGGATTVLEAEGVTAADYAREGFFQLVAVAAIALTVVHLAHRLGGGDRLLVAAIGIGLAVLIAISYSRLGYYMDAFGVTMLRLSVATFLGWLAIMTALSVGRAWGLGPDRNWLATAGVVAAGLLAVGYGLADPEGYILVANLDRAETLDEVDLYYLTTLSDDARLAAVDYDWTRFGGMPPEIKSWLCEANPESTGGFLSWNRSRAATARVVRC